MTSNQNDNKKFDIDHNLCSLIASFMYLNKTENSTHMPVMFFNILHCILPNPNHSLCNNEIRKMMNDYFQNKTNSKHIYARNWISI